MSEGSCPAKPVRRVFRGTGTREVSTGHQHSSRRYEIRLKGHLDSRWAAWFDGLTFTNESDGTTVIEGLVVDQAALHGLLRKLRDVGLPLLSVIEVEPDQPAARTIPRP